MLENKDLTPKIQKTSQTRQKEWTKKFNHQTKMKVISG